MDFIKILFLANRKQAIMVVIDQLSKCGHLTALPYPFIATTIIEVFFSDLYARWSFGPDLH